jgi:phenylacetate-coenzyme A ligase PaaK-like adenylate-forming protein
MNAIRLRQLILEAAEHSRVADFYCVSELGLVAYSRPGISGFQVLTKDFHLELLRTPGTALERLVVTDLGGGALPLIRFDTQDLVRRDTARPGAPIVAIGRGAVDGLEAAQGECLTPYEVERALARAERPGKRPATTSGPAVIEGGAWAPRAPWPEAALRP